MKRHTISFMHASAGIWYAVRTQPNFVIHLAISAAVVVAGLWLRLAWGEWAIVCLTISVGLVIELVNTSIESTVDLVTDKIHPLARIAKDCASAAMLVYALGAAVVGLVIFIPKLLIIL